MDFRPFLRNLYDVLPGDSVVGDVSDDRYVSSEEGLGEFSDDFWEVFCKERGFDSVDKVPVDNVLEERPWFGLYRDIVRDGNLSSNDELRKARKLAIVRFGVEHTSGLKRVGNVALNWFVAAAVVGMANDELASKLAPYTGFSKKYCQDWNVPFSMVDHSIFVVGGLETALNSANYGEFVSDFGSSSLYVTAPMAAGNIFYNFYRLANRDDKARPAFGYMGLALNGGYYLKKHFGDFFHDKFLAVRDYFSDSKKFIRSVFRNVDEGSFSEKYLRSDQSLKTISVKYRVGEGVPPFGVLLNDYFFVDSSNFRGDNVRGGVSGLEDAVNFDK